MVDRLNTKVEILELDEHKNYGRFSMSPLERGYGTTIGNSLRRVLLSSCLLYTSCFGCCCHSLRAEKLAHDNRLNKAYE